LSTSWSNKGEFTFSYTFSLYAVDCALAKKQRAAYLAATNAIYGHLNNFGLLMHVCTGGKE
jgi:hypothetical protein